MKLEEFKNITIAYMRRVGAYGSKNKLLMEDFKHFLADKHLLDEKSVIFGIALDDPSSVPEAQLRYDVGLVINEGQSIDLSTRQIDDGTYAVFEIPHTEEGVLSFWQNFHTLAAGLPVDRQKPIMERYAAEKLSRHLCEFCIPLRQE